MRTLSSLLLFSILTLSLGCGDGEETLYPVSGTVTYSGEKTIPKGMIYFDPDSSKGTKGQMGFAEITNGAFDTKLNGKGVKAASYNVRVSGYDGIPAEEAPYGKALFPEYTMTVTFQATENTLLVHIPKTGK